jgi:uncharacterized membrane protein YkoI
VANIHMTRRMAVAGVALALVGASGVAMATGGLTRLDDGADLSAKATITEKQAIAAAQASTTGTLNEVDLEYAGDRLVFNVDVGAHDVKVDAQSGELVSIDADD